MVRVHVAGSVAVIAVRTSCIMSLLGDATLDGAKQAALLGEALLGASSPLPAARVVVARLGSCPGLSGDRCSQSPCRFCGDVVRQGPRLLAFAEFAF
eukprot:8271067-Alexandrium_andersonii.AAC.1